MAARKLCEEGGGAGLSRSELDEPPLQLFSTAGSTDIVFVTLFPTTVERASCEVHNVLCIGWPDSNHVIVLVLTVLFAFAGQGRLLGTSIA